MHLLRYRPRRRELRLPNGARVKITVNELATGQEVEDQFDRRHATARPMTTLGRLRADGRQTAGPTRWALDDDLDLWTPLPEECTK